MFTYKLNRDFVSRSEIQRAFYLSKIDRSSEGCGQAFWNTFGIVGQTWPELCLERRDERVIQMVHEHVMAKNEEEQSPVACNSGWDNLN